MSDDVPRGRHTDIADTGGAGAGMDRTGDAPPDRGTGAVRWHGITTGVTYPTCADCFANDTRCYGSSPGAAHFEVRFDECDAFTELASRGRNDYPHAGADTPAKSHVRTTGDARRRLLRHGKRRGRGMCVGRVHADAIAAYARMRDADAWRGLHLARIVLGRGN